MKAKEFSRWGCWNNLTLPPYFFSYTKARINGSRSVANERVMSGYKTRPRQSTVVIFSFVTLFLSISPHWRRRPRPRGQWEGQVAFGLEIVWSCNRLEIFHSTDSSPTALAIKQTSILFLAILFLKQSEATSSQWARLDVTQLFDGLSIAEGGNQPLCWFGVQSIIHRLENEDIPFASRLVRSHHPRFSSPASPIRDSIWRPADSPEGAKKSIRSYKSGHSSCGPPLSLFFRKKMVRFYRLNRIHSTQRLLWSQCKRSRPHSGAAFPLLLPRTPFRRSTLPPHCLGVSSSVCQLFTDQKK